MASPDPVPQQSFRKQQGWVAEGRSLAGQQGRSAFLAGLVVLGVTLLSLAAVGYGFYAPGKSLVEIAASQHFAIPAGGIVLTGFAGIAALVVSSRRGSRLFSSHLRQGELTLAQSEVIISATNNGILIINEEGRLHTVNAAAERIFGVAAAKVLGQHASIFIPDRTVLQDRTNLPRTVSVVGQRNGTQSIQLELNLSELTIDGRRHLVAIIRAASEKERGSEIFKHISLGISPAPGGDATRILLRELSKALGTRRAFLLEILGEGPSAVAMRTLAEDGELRGTSAIDLRNSACGEVLVKGFRMLPSGAREAFPEDTMLAENNTVGFAGAPLLDHRGRVLGSIGVLHEQPLENEAVIDTVLKIFACRGAAELERKRFDEALGAEKERLAVTLRSIGDACVTLDNDGRIVLFNAVAERLTGWVYEDASGKLVHDVLHLVDERTRRRSQHLLQRIVSNGFADSANALNVLISREGEERTVESSGAPIRDRLGRKLGSIIVLRDVTEQLRAQEERMKAEKLESLGLVAGGIAHDFNNVLTAILGNVTLTLANRDLPSELATHLEAARKASQRAQELAGQLLTFAKGGAPVKQATNLGQLLTSTMHCAVAGSRSTCNTTIAGDLWSVEVDPGQLSQVIANLISNADQAMPSGGTIHVIADNFELPLDSVSLGLRAGRWVRFAIEDHGVGIPSEYLKKIFDPYFTTKPTGSGLGLATAYSIVKNHGGAILVESKPAEGSTFAVYLPASEKPVEMKAFESAPVTAPAEGKRVLVLDDEEVICMLVTCALEPLGYEVTETQDGLVALEKYEESMKSGRKYDLVISDLTMPGRMSGQEAIKRLLDLDPQVRAIVSSGYANDPVMSRFQEFGFSGMIAKPYDIDALGRKVAEVLAQPASPRVIYHDFDSRKSA